ncbi:MAG: peptidase [Chloroflexi bacterium]|nr:peptidase [Chloroflexota bacterium]
MPLVVEKAWDETRLKRERLALLQKQMQAHDIGALYLGEVNLRYVLNTKIPGGQVFVPAEGDPITFVQERDLGWVSQQGETRPRLQGNRSEEGDRHDQYRPFGYGIAGLMEECGVSGLPLGVDSLETGGVLALQEAGVRLIDASVVMEQAGGIKTDDEVSIYRAIGKQYVHTFSAFRQAIRPGISENELAGVVHAAWFEAGGEEISQLNVCSGPNMNPWSRWPTQRPLDASEFVGIDFHGRGSGGLRGDASRTYFVGAQPTTEQRDLYRRGYDYLQRTADAIRAGRTYADVLDAVPEVPGTFRVLLDNYHIFHGIGMSYAEVPRVDRKIKKLDTVLVPNQVLAVESYFGEMGSPLAVKLEEMILVRDGAPEVLSGDVPYDERFIG